jgi:urease alpha subunit
MMTIDAAYIVSQEDYIGSLESGKFADLIVLSDSPLDVHADELKDLEVYLTMIGGNIEYVKEGSEFTDLITTPPIPIYFWLAVGGIAVVLVLVVIFVKRR